MSANRTSVSVKSDHIKAFAHLVELVRLGDFSGAIDYIKSVATDMQNLGGALDQADRAQYPGDYGSAPPPPTGDGPLARFDAAPSQLAKWAPSVHPGAEDEALVVRYVAQGTPEADIRNRISLMNNFYGPGSSGGVNVNVVRKADGSYWFWKLADGVESLVPDVGGAGDAYVAAICATTGRPVIAPLG